MNEGRNVAVDSLVNRLDANTEPTMNTLDHEWAEDGMFLNRLVRTLPGMVYRCHPDAARTMDFASIGCRKLTGFEPHDLVENGPGSYASLIHQDDRELVQAAVESAVIDGKPFKVTYRLRRLDGREIVVQEHGCVVYDHAGSAEIVEGFVMGIDEHSVSSDRLTSEETRFRALVEQSLVGVYVLRDNRFDYVNSRFAQLFGYSTDEVLALPSILELVAPEDRTLVADNIGRRVGGELDEIRYEFRGLTKDGTEFDLEVHGSRVDLSGAPAILGTLLDIGERKSQARRQGQALALEALRRLAAGVAHDLNNFLGTIRMTAEVLVLERSSDLALVEDINGIVKAVDRGAELSNHLTRLGRKQTDELDRTSLSSAITDLTHALRPILGKRIELRVDVDESLPMVALRPADAEELLLNLALNAQDAMPSGGTITIRATSADQDQSGRVDRSVRSSVRLEVANTGVVMTPEMRARLFDADVTSQGDPRLGIGLSSVRRIVIESGGTVRVDSSPDSGTTFLIEFPAAPAD